MLKKVKLQPVKLDIEFISVNKPDTKKAARLLGPMLYKMFEQRRMQEQLK